MTMKLISIATVLRLERLSDEAFAPFGELVQAPREVGTRASYTRWLGDPPAGMTLRLHVNRIAPTMLPIAFATLERHPLSAQIFLPLDVQEYLVVVAPSEGGGAPLFRDAIAFLAPGHLGIVYAPGTWHTGMTVLGSAASFGVLMWRNDTDQDEEFFTLPAPLRVAR